MTDDRSLRAQLIRLLEADDAHMTFEDAVADFPDEAVNARPPNVGYTPWHLVEHLRLTQRLEFNSTGAVINAERTFTAKFEVLGSSTASQLGRCSR